MKMPRCLEDIVVPTTIENLENRVRTLEEQMAAVKKGRVALQPSDASRPPGRRILERAKENQSRISHLWHEAFRQLIPEDVKPISVVRLREEIAKSGIDPRGNEFSRAINQMREE
jgi:hypothetical protein